MRGLDDEDEETRVMSIHHLGAFGEGAKDSVPKLADILIHADASRERREAAETLRKIGTDSKPAVMALARAVDDRDPWVRWNAATALIILGPDARPAVPALIKVMNDKENQTNLDEFVTTIQDSAVLALGKATRGTDEAVPAIVAALKDYDKDTRDIIIRTVQGQGRGGMPGAGAKGKGKAAQKAPQKQESSKASEPPAKAPSPAKGEAPKAPPKKQKTDMEIICTKVCFARALGEIGPPAAPAIPVLKDMLTRDQISDFKKEAELAIQAIEGKDSTAKQ
jgi:hypothetical protein